MKKHLIILLVAILVCFSGCARISEASVFYDGKATVDGVDFVINKLAKNSYASEYTYVKEGTRDIVIPDEYSGYPVTKLGGFYGRGVMDPFCITVARDASVIEALAGETIEEAEIIEINFNLYIGKNVKEICGVIDLYSMDFNEQGEKIAYHPTVYVICDEENEHFYSENGKLYNNDGALVEGFAYSEFPAE